MAEMQRRSGGLDAQAAMNRERAAALKPLFVLRHYDRDLLAAAWASTSPRSPSTRRSPPWARPGLALNSIAWAPLSRRAPA
jgi:hypothetical protein